MPTRAGAKARLAPIWRCGSSTASVRAATPMWVYISRHDDYARTDNAHDRIDNDCDRTDHDGRNYDDIGVRKKGYEGMNLQSSGGTTFAAVVGGAQRRARKDE